jgi:NAD(P)-dependent dehydrogenase (short-subunit alcohol dehydrogenase family)
MSAVTTDSTIPREPELLGQTVVFIGGSAGIGLETARHARAQGAEVDARQDGKTEEAAKEGKLHIEGER